jgi:excisionase family DNA binding protein
MPTASARPDSPSLVDEVEVPSIERYLPFLRTQTPSEDSEGPSKPASTEALGPNDAAAPPAVVESAPPAVEHHVEVSSVAAKAEPSPAPAETAGAETQASTAVHTNAPDTLPIPDTEGAHLLVRRVSSGHRRARPSKHADPAEIAETLGAGGLWELVPKHIQTLIAIGSDEVPQNSYKREFRETRLDLIGRLLDPTLSLEETARLLNVCPTTVRRYTNRGLLTHQRTQGDQRRFKLSDVLAFLEAQSRTDNRNRA